MGTVTLFSKSQLSSFGCSTNSKLYHPELLERGTESILSVQMQNPAVLSASNGMSAADMSCTGRACIEHAYCVLLSLYDSCVDAKSDTSSAFTKPLKYTHSIKYSTILSEISGPSNCYFKGDCR